jgi:high-affinity Fe2+/Pb2+ permease
LPRPGTPHTGATSGRKKTPAPTARSAGGILSTFCLVSATATLVCGGVLLGEALWGGRPELWQIGLPIALVGQVILVLGLLLRLNRLHHAAAKKITAVDRELRHLKTATHRRESAHESLGGVFSTQNADDADPQSLLGDLKSQLNLLAKKIGQLDK